MSPESETFSVFNKTLHGYICTGNINQKNITKWCPTSVVLRPEYYRFQPKRIRKNQSRHRASNSISQPTIAVYKKLHNNPLDNITLLPAKPGPSGLIVHSKKKYFALRVAASCPRCGGKRYFQPGMRYCQILDMRLYCTDFIKQRRSLAPRRGHRRTAMTKKSRNTSPALYPHCFDKTKFIPHRMIKKYSKTIF